MKKNILIKIKNLKKWLKNYAANFKASNYLKAYLGISFVFPFFKTTKTEIFPFI